MLLPVFFHMTGPIAAAVLVGAIASSLLYSSTLAFPYTYPREKSPATAGIAAIAALITLTIVCVLPAIVFWTIPTPNGWRQYALASSSYLFVQAIYSMLLTIAVRRSDYSIIVKSRLQYGVANLVSTMVAIFCWRHSKWGLVVAGEISFVTASIAVIALLKDEFRPLWTSVRTLSATGLVRHISRQWKVAVTSLLDGTSYQIGGLALAGLGQLSASWAIVTRVSGGFGGIITQLAAPYYDMRLSAAVREMDSEGMACANRRGLHMGAVLAAVAIIVSSAGVLASGSIHGLNTNQLTALIIGMTFFWGTSLVLAVVAKGLVFLRKESMRLVWTVSRWSALISAVILTTAETRLLLLGLFGALSTLAYFALVYLVSRRQASLPNAIQRVSA